MGESSGHKNRRMGRDRRSKRSPVGQDEERQQRPALRQRSTRQRRSPVDRQIDGLEKSTEVAQRAGSGQRAMAHALCRSADKQDIARAAVILDHKTFFDAGADSE